MVRDLDLKRELRTVRFIFKGRAEERKVEVRFDPITGRRCRILEKAFLVPPGTDFSEILDETECPFCGPNLEEGTPRFPNDIVPDGRIREGKVQLIPNLFPYADHTAVIVFKEHFKPIDGFSKEELADAFRCAKRYIELVHRADPKARFCSINWNYMPPSGGTVIHPHLQVIVDRYPTFLQELMIKGSEARPGLWEDYVAKERDLDERYITKVGKVHLIAPFAPMGFDQVDGVIEGVSCVPELTKKDLEDLALSVNQVLGFYGHLKRSSFNMALYSSPLDKPQGEGPMWLNFKMLGRSNLRPFYRSDAGYTERLHYESVVNKPPELVASQMKEYLKKKNNE
jgi:UDPglucose--hexose-1-phosphate uridylyltransferase